MATLKISGFPAGISLQPALTVNGTEKIPVDQTVAGVLGTVNATMAQLLGGATSINYATGQITIGNPTSGTGTTLTINNPGTTNDCLDLNTTGRFTTIGFFNNSVQKGQIFYDNNTGNFVISGPTLVSQLTFDTGGNQTTFNAGAAGQFRVSIIQPGTAAADLAEHQLSSGATAMAQFVANANNVSSIITGGPTGPQGVLRVLGTGAPLVFGTANTFRGQIGADGQWTIAAPNPTIAGTTLTINAASTTNPAQGIVINNDGAHNVEMVLSSTTAGDAYYRSVAIGVTGWSMGTRRSDGALVFGEGVGIGTPSFFIASTTRAATFNPGSSATGITILGNATGDSFVVTLPSASVANIWKGTNVLGTISADLTSAGIGEIGTSSNTDLHIFTNNATRLTISAAGLATFVGQVQAPTFLATTVAGAGGAGQISYGSTTAATATAGGGAALPATVAGFIIVGIAGTLRKIPFYAT